MPAQPTWAGPVLGWVRDAFGTHLILPPRQVWANDSSLARISHESLAAHRSVPQAGSEFHGLATAVNETSGPGEIS